MCNVLLGVSCFIDGAAVQDHEVEFVLVFVCVFFYKAGRFIG